MLKKIQRRFILAAMAAFGTVMLLIIVGINAANYYRTTSMQDRLVEALFSHEQNVPAKPRAAPACRRYAGKRPGSGVYDPLFYSAL